MHENKLILYILNQMMVKIEFSQEGYHDYIIIMSHRIDQLDCAVPRCHFLMVSLQPLMILSMVHAHGHNLGEFLNFAHAQWVNTTI